MADLAELLERVKAASGPDRQLDLAIAQLFGRSWSYEGEPPRNIKCGAYTASLDAALALVKRIEPQAVWLVQYATAGAYGQVYLPGQFGSAYAPTAPLALLTALLSALAAQGDVGSAYPERKIDAPE